MVKGLKLKYYPIISITTNLHELHPCQLPQVVRAFRHLPSRLGGPRGLELQVFHQLLCCQVDQVLQADLQVQVVQSCQGHRSLLLRPFKLKIG